MIINCFTGNRPKCAHLHELPLHPDRDRTGSGAGIEDWSSSHPIDPIPPHPLPSLLTRIPFPGREKRSLHVTVTNPVQCSLHGRKCTVSVETKINQSQPDFTKHRSGFVLCVPGN